MSDSIPEKWPDLPPFHFRPGQCSAVVVVPRRAFRELLRARGFEAYVAEEEGGLWVIPRRGRLGGSEALVRLMEPLKPSMLKVELGRVPNLLREFSDRLTAETFDRYFKLKVRDEVNDIRELWPPGTVERGQAGT